MNAIVLFFSIMNIFFVSTHEKYLSCKKCIHYNANPLNKDFFSPSNLCNKFNTFAVQCRNDKDNCRFWEEEPNFLQKLFWFSYEKNMLILKEKTRTITKEFVNEDEDKNVDEYKNVDEDEEKKELMEIKQIVQQFIEYMDAKSREKK